MPCWFHLVHHTTGDCLECGRFASDVGIGDPVFLALPLALVLLWLFKTRLPLDRVSLHSYLAGACSFIGSQILLTGLRII